MWPNKLYSLLGVSCLLFVMIHRRHGDVLAAPIQSSHRPRSSIDSSLQEIKSEFPSPKISEAIMVPRKKQKLVSVPVPVTVSVSGSNMELPAPKIKKKSPMLGNYDDSKSEQQEAASSKERRGVRDLDMKHIFARDVMAGATKPWAKELTIPLARGIVDSWGRRIKNPWTVTYGDVWQDTRLAAKFLSRVPRIYLASSPIVDYYPDDKKLASVCQSKSTVPGDVVSGHMVDWTRRHHYLKAFKYRKYDPIRDQDLQRQEFLLCHLNRPRKTKVVEFLTCSINGFMRMYGSLPGYPMAQNADSYHPIIKR